MKKSMRIFAGAFFSVVLAGNLLACGSAGSASSSVNTSSGASAAESTAESSTPAGAETDGETVTITDEADRQVTVPLNPERAAILDIYPIPAALTVFLNSAEGIVAMEPASMNAAKNSVLSELYPEILNVSTDIMSGDSVNIEALIALDPQVVFYSAGSQEEGDALVNAGLNAVAISPSKWNYDCIRTYDEWTSLFGQIYPDRSGGREKLVSDYSTKKYEEIREKVKDIPDADRQKVLFLFQYDDTKMITSGKNFFGQWWCDSVGAVNAAEEVSGENRNAQITMEQVYEWNPDVIIITNFTQTQPDDLLSSSVGDDDWSTVKAVQDGRVYKMPLGTYRTYTPGVDTPITLEWLAQKVYPDLFAEVDVKADTVDYYKNIYGITLTDDQVEKMFHPDPSGSRLN